MVDFEKAFEEKTGIILSQTLGSSNAVTVFKNRTTTMITEYVKEQYPNYDITLLTDLQTTAITNAIIEQGFYMISTGVDLTTYLGIDSVTGNITPLDEIKKRTISPFAKKILKNAGLMYKGYGGSSAMTTYDEVRRFWRWLY